MNLCLYTSPASSTISSCLEICHNLLSTVVHKLPAQTSRVVGVLRIQPGSIRFQWMDLLAPHKQTRPSWPVIETSNQEQADYRFLNKEYSQRWRRVSLVQSPLGVSRAAIDGWTDHVSVPPDSWRMRRWVWLARSRWVERQRISK